MTDGYAHYYCFEHKREEHTLETYRNDGSRIDGIPCDCEKLTQEGKT